MKVEHVKQVMDGTSVGVAVATLTNILPSVAALFTIVWTAIRIWETETIQSLRRRWFG